MEEQELQNINESAANLVKYLSREYGVYDVEGFFCPHVRELAKNLIPFHKDLLVKRPDPPPEKDCPPKPGPGPKG